MYLCADIELPDTVDFESNTNADGSEELLTRQIGISENSHTPKEGESRNPCHIEGS